MSVTILNCSKSTDDNLLNFANPKTKQISFKKQLPGVGGERA